MMADPPPGPTRDQYLLDYLALYIYSAVLNDYFPILPYTKARYPYTII